ncbi:MAG: class IV adenylate cyclase [Treponema sp.]|jgi:adenylate cyclase class 2|nr:class IV adenylate cyclase [Treponema sp.]
MMTFEIELKARVEAPETVKKRLSALGKYEAAYEKDDTYWVSPFENSGLPPSGLRVRRETSVDKAGKTSKTNLATYKIRKIQDGIEVNEEREFAVSDGETFEDLLGRLGLKRKIRKSKRGWAWIYGPPETRAPPERETAEAGSPIRMELSDVGELGWFLELEILAPRDDDALVARCRGELLDLLEKTGLSTGKIENRPYTEMLAAKRAGLNENPA